MNVIELPTIDAKTSLLNVVIEVPKGTRNKWKYDEKLQLFRLSKVLPAGSVFPFDFGFLPSRRSPDGAPLDVLVFSEEPAVVGAVLPVRLLGVIEAEQREAKKVSRNDRLLGVVETPYNRPREHTLDDLGPGLLDAVETFFITYNRAEGREFKPLARRDAEHARGLIDEARDSFRKN